MVRDGIYYALGFTAAGVLISWLSGPRASRSRSFCWPRSAPGSFATRNVRFPSVPWPCRPPTAKLSPS